MHAFACRATDGAGFIYLAAVLDWFTRRVLAWRVSITLEADFCVEAVEEALARHGTPEIFNTDQGSQFTSTDFIKVLAAREIKPHDLAGADFHSGGAVFVLGGRERVLWRGRGDKHRVHRRDLFAVQLGIIILIEQEQLHDGGGQFRHPALSICIQN